MTRVICLPADPQIRQQMANFIARQASKLTRRARPPKFPVPAGPEEDLAGLAAATAKGARLSVSRVAPEDCWDPRVARVLRYANNTSVVEAEMAAPPGDKQETRLGAVAALADIDISWLQRVVNDRPTTADTSRVVAGQVKAAALRRQIMIAAADVHEAAWTGHLATTGEAARRLVAIVDQWHRIQTGSSDQEAVEW